MKRTQNFKGHSPTLLLTAFVPIWSTAEISQDLAKRGGWEKCSILRVDKKVLLCEDVAKATDNKKNTEEGFNEKPVSIKHAQL